MTTILTIVNFLSNTFHNDFLAITALNTLDLLKRTLRQYEPIDWIDHHPHLHDIDKIADNLKKKNPSNKKVPKFSKKVKEEVKRLLTPPKEEEYSDPEPEQDDDNPLKIFIRKYK